MIRRLVISRDAETDLTLIWVYHAERSDRAAKRIRYEIASNYDLLLQFPGMGRKREEVRKGLRSFPVGDYVIFYREFTDGIEVLRVLHGAQDVVSVFAVEEDSEEVPPID